MSHYHSENALLVLRSEDLYRDDPQPVLRQAVEHIFQGYVPIRDLPLRDVTSEVRNEGSYTPMNPGTRQRLQEYFAPHNRELYELLGRDFGW